MHAREVTTAATYVARLETGADWRTELETLADDVDADAAWFTALGAVQDAELWFYDQDDLEYRPIVLDEPLEVASCVGNVSLQFDDSEKQGSSSGGERFAHTHAVLSRPDGETVAGHLHEATVFAGEAYMQVFDAPLERSHDETTDLDLWL
jgi:predicted DNA-binding protein with PD1-like motif